MTVLVRLEKGFLGSIPLTTVTFPALLYDRTDSKNAPKDSFSVSKSGDDYGGVTAEGQDAGDAEGLQEEPVEGAADMGAGPTSAPENEQVSGSSSSSSSSDHNGDGRRLGRERPAVLEEVLHEDVISEFNYLGSSGDAFGMVGCVVASVSREPFCTTEVSLKVCPRHYSGGVAALILRYLLERRSFSNSPP